MSECSRTLAAIKFGALLFFVGCGQETAPTGQSLEAGAAVTIVERHDDVSLVKTVDGVVGYVPNSRLQAPAGALASDSDAERVLTAATTLRPDRPTEVSTSSGASPPRPVAEINQERKQLNVLYLSDDGSELLGPKSSGPFADPQSGDVYWPAWTCTSANCAGAQGGNRFPGVLDYLEVKTDGTFAMKDVNQSRTGLRCPVCGESDGLRPHVLPETAARLERLNDEHRRRLAWERENR